MVIFSALYLKTKDGKFGEKTSFPIRLVNTQLDLPCLAQAGVRPNQGYPVNRYPVQYILLNVGLLRD